MLEWWLAGGAVLAGGGLSLRYHWWRQRVQGVPVLCYDQVVESRSGSAPNRCQVTAANFGRQLDLLSRLGYQSVTLGAALAPNCPPKAVVITFDHGFADFFDLAWPQLRSRGMTATVFLVTGRLDGYNQWESSRPGEGRMLLSRHLVRELAGRGVEFGGHSHSHLDLTILDAKGLRREVVGCQKVLTDILGGPARVFSYPYGKYDQRVINEVHQAGFTAACTSEPGMLQRGAEPSRLPRIGMGRRDDLMDLRLKLTRTCSTFR